jgi:hypothetical protein
VQLPALPSARAACSGRIHRTGGTYQSVWIAGGDLSPFGLVARETAGWLPDLRFSGEREDENGVSTLSRS